MPDTAVKNFNSTMVGAPALNSNLGAMLSVLDACLVDGFDLKTITSLVVASGVATVVYSGSHSAGPDSVILVAGVTGGPSGFAALNAEQKVATKPNATTFTFPTTAADGTYTGTITIKMAPLGWVKAFNGTNKAAYRSADVASSQALLRVDDTYGTHVRVIGYESMTDVDTGVGAFPTPAQFAGGGYWPKIRRTSTTPIAWSIVGDGRLFYFTCLAGSLENPDYTVGTTRCFGDPIALRPGGDPYSTVLNYSTSVTPDYMLESDVGFGTLNNTASPRGPTGLGSSILQTLCAYTGGTTASGISNVLGSFPNPVDGALYLSKKTIINPVSFVPRADLPGLYHLPQSGIFDTFKWLNRSPGTGPLSGRQLMAVPIAGSGASFGGPAYASASGAVMLDVTGPWR